ncbi:hypothetical protein DSO57_1004326 [Entomophthora muscae]|uniref:Uncharacterized protein n=1 Tax=Entomophthora muscae TaxID=34485 RepID=A0ACC2SKV8_9FUNG|nr:hypothetical protein DSO57_1004326 [Entomophthora muscae]
MKLPKTPLMESLGYKWLFWIVLTTTVFTSTSMGSCADLGTTPESQFLDSSWRRVILGVWYTATPLLNSPPVREETKVYGFTTQVTKPQVFCPLASAFLLCYLGVYFFLGRFNPLLGRYQLFRELFHLGMVSLPVGSLVTGLNPYAIIHHLGRLPPSGWVPDTIIGKWIPYFLARSIYFCTNVIFLFAFICISTTLYNLTHLLLLATKSDHFGLHAGDSS